MRVKFLTLGIASCLVFSSGCSSARGGATQSVAPDSRDDYEEEEIKPYHEVITADATSDSGLFEVHWVGDKLYFEIPDSLLEREMLVVSRIARTATGLGYGGQEAASHTFRWQRLEQAILLRLVSHVNVAEDTLPIHRAVESSNLEPIVEAFPIRAVNPDTNATVIEVTDLYSTDVRPFGLPQFRRERHEVRGVDEDRSFIASARSYPRNIEVSAILTYRAAEPPSGDPLGAFTVELNHSMVLLPREPMRPRLWDERVGYLSIRQTDYGRPEHRAVERRYITRWRLEPSDPEAFGSGELVEPVRPITYYIDPATPRKWRPYLRQGVEDWNVAFEAAGFRNAIRALDAPSQEEDSEFSPEDVRYSVIRYFPSSIQNASGPHVHDPRSGEILEADIYWYHNVMNLLRNWYFIQTAAANPLARATKLDDSVMGQLIRFAAAHEVGHTLGLPHNMKASSSYPVDSLRAPGFTCRMGTAPSIMDYARFNYVAQPGDRDICFLPRIGDYDIYSVRWGYRPIPQARSPDEELSTLHQWIRDREDDPVYWFGNPSLYDPTALTEAIGDDAMEAGELGIRNLAIIVDSLIAWTYQEGEDYDQLEELYEQVVGQWNRYLGHVMVNIGGVYREARTFDQGPVFRPVERGDQERAMDFLAEYAFPTPAWLLNDSVFARIEPAGAVERIRRRQVGVLNQLLDTGRMQRLIDGRARSEGAYSLDEMLDDARGAIWSELPEGRNIDPYRRNLQRGYVERMRFLMNEDAGSSVTEVDVSQSDIRAFIRGNLSELGREVAGALRRGGTDRATRLHLQDVAVRIEEILEGEG